MKLQLTGRSANILLFLISSLWGSGFVVTKMALDANVTAGFITFARGLIFTILTFLLFHKKIVKLNRLDFKIGLIAGLLNFGGAIAQTVGVKYTTPSNNAFISATYVVIVPFIAWLAYKKPLRLKSLVSISFCMVGMAILTGVMAKGMQVNIGDIYSFLSAISYAGSIAYIGYSARETDSTVVAFMMAAVQTLGGLAHFMFIDGAQLSGVNWQAAIIPLLYMGVLCSFLAQTLQVFAQRHTSATTAGLIMMLEGFFGSLFSVAFGFERFTGSLALGGAVIMLALTLMEVDYKKISEIFSKNIGKKSV